jgi:tetratricopeptide (TPR) repeat protein
VRFGLAEALRQLASELLDREPDGRRWRHAHAQRQYELVWGVRTWSVDRKTWLAAHSAEREAGAALRWATINHDPCGEPLAAAYAFLLLESGRVREADAITERVLDSPFADAEVRCIALLAHARYLGWAGQRDEALRFADQAYGLAPNAEARCVALIHRGFQNLFGGHVADAVKDHAEATALARELHDPAFLAGALVAEAQALGGARLLDEAAARLDEARTVGSPVDANALYYLNTHIGDLAIFDGRPADALKPFAWSLERALAESNLMQIVNDLFGVAEALAALGRDAESLEVTGMAYTQGAEIGVESTIPFDYEHLAALEQRIGPARAAELKRHGHAAGPADRVARACKLARSHALAPTAPRE